MDLRKMTKLAHIYLRRDPAILALRALGGICLILAFTTVQSRLSNPQPTDQISIVAWIIAATLTTAAALLLLTPRPTLYRWIGYPPQPPQDPKPEDTTVN
jgi:hypothetical protein